MSISGHELRQNKGRKIEAVKLYKDQIDMKPHIDRTEFRSITVDGETYDHDIVIRPSGNVKKREKKLSTSTTMAQNAGAI